MSSTSDPHRDGFTDHALYRRTVAEIQQEVIKKSERNVVPRVFNAKDDKEMIAGWKLDLNKILHIFSVRPADCTRLSLIVLFQAELATGTHMEVSDLHRKSIGNQHPSVSAPFCPSTIEHSPSPDSSQVSNLEQHRVHDLTFVQRPSWRTASTAAEGLFRT